MEKRRRKIQSATCVSAIATTSKYHDLVCVSLKGIGTLTDVESNINASKHIDI